MSYQGFEDYFESLSMENDCVSDKENEYKLWNSTFGCGNDKFFITGKTKLRCCGPYKIERGDNIEQINFFKEFFQLVAAWQNFYAFLNNRKNVKMSDPAVKKFMAQFLSIKG